MVVASEEAPATGRCTRTATHSARTRVTPMAEQIHSASVTSLADEPRPGRSGRLVGIENRDGSDRRRFIGDFDACWLGAHAVERAAQWESLLLNGDLPSVTGAF